MFIFTLNGVILLPMSALKKHRIILFGEKMQTWKLNIINKLSEKSMDNNKINLYETAKDLGYNDILITEAQDIVEKFLEINPNFKVIKSYDKTNPTQLNVLQTIILEKLSLEEISKLNNISKIRKIKGYTQSKLAELSGVNIRLIQKYESGERDFKKAQVLTAIKIADALQITVDELIRT